MDDVITELSELIENYIARVPRKLGAFVVDLFDVALRARGPDDVLWPLYPRAKPVKTLFAHTLRQDGDSTAIEDAGNRDAAATVIPGRWPNRLMALRVKPAGHQM